MDGLPSDSEDFRFVGDLIEPECIPDLERAMAGQTVMPEKISKTTWGAIFISYFPMHRGDEVVGVLGMEFAADEQAHSFRTMAVATTVVILLSCLIAAAIAVLLFRRISNPSYRDMASTDFLTGLKNRNAFERDLYNLNSAADKSRFAVISADLNGLKSVNDTYGHAEGDRYIRLCADILSACLPEGGRLYRIGGDEFVMLLPQVQEQTVVRTLEQIRREICAAGENTAYPLGLSLGWARYNEERDGSLVDTLKRSDAEMYACKKRGR